MDIERLRRVIDDRLRRVNTCIPGKIKSYDASKREAEIEPQIDDTYADGSVVQMPVLTGVPVVQQTTAGGGLVLPVAAGDGVLVLFSQRSLDRWAKTGNRGVSGDVRMHAMSDAIAIVGLLPFTESHSDGDGVRLYQGDMTVRLKDGKVGIGTSLVELLEQIVEGLNQTAAGVCANGAPLSTSTLIAAAATKIETLRGPTT
jgi:hypothetical protein